MVDANPLDQLAEASTRKDFALALAQTGFWIFPLRENSKLPKRDGRFADYATRDPGQIALWWNSASRSNIGIATEKFGDDGEALLVVDIDCRDGKPGDESWFALTDQHGTPPSTFEVKTASGGRHLFFRTPRAVTSRNGKLAAGIDVKSWGGFVAAPGSTFEGGEYRVATPAPIAEAPQWLVDLCGGPRQPRVRTTTATAAARAGIDHTAAMERARAWLTSHAELAVEGHGGDATTFRVAARLRDFGVSEAGALDLLLEHWNPRCSPPWLPDELAVKVRNAFEYAASAPGIASPEADFHPVPTEERQMPIHPNLAAAIAPDALAAFAAELAGKGSPEAIKPAPRRRLSMKPFGELKLTAAPPWLIRDWLPSGGLAMLVGASGAGKTHAALDIAASVATGRTWNGCKAEAGAVVCVALENPASVERRLLAIRKDKNLADDVPIFVIRGAVNLASNSGEDAKALLDEITEAGRIAEQPVRLVVIDTLTRAVPGADENSATDMGRLVARLDEIKAATGACVLVLHHVGKDASRGARGSSALRAAVDTEILVEHQTLKVTKQRDGEEGRRAAFTLDQVVLGKIDDELVAAPVVRWGTVTRGGPNTLSKNAEAALSALEHMAGMMACR